MVNRNSSSKPFLPRDKPKSWIIFVISGLVGLLLAAPMAICGVVFQVDALRAVGTTLLWCFWAIGATMWLIYIFRSIAGRYKEIEERDWGQQVW